MRNKFKFIFILTSILIIGFIGEIYLGNSMQVNAKTKNLSSSTVKAMKKGTLPGAIGSIGMSYKTLKSKSPKIKWSDADPIGMVSWKNDIYGLKSNSSNSKVLLISRSYNYTISKKSIKKLLGKSYKTSAPESTYYKVGRYLVRVSKYSGRSTIWMGTDKTFGYVPGLGFK